MSTPRSSSKHKVLLLSMPYGALERQALGVSLLKASLRDAGIVCDVRYATFVFAQLIGLAEYVWISTDLPYTAFTGDWTFTQALYGTDQTRDAAYIQKVLRETWLLDEHTIARIIQIRSRVEHFLSYTMALIPWSQYKIVGFTSTFEQNLASLALATRVKQAHPEISVVFGGANFEGEMGLQLHRKFNFIDYVCSGEADHSFPELATSLLAGRAGNDLAPIRGIIYRQGTGSVSTGPPDLVRDLDQLPIPDFSDYFQGLAENAETTPVSPVILLETSRGCWWGAKSHCTFCGLNGGTMAFRSKSPRRALAELEYLVDRWQLDYIEVVDNILDMKYFDEMLPALAESGRSVRLFYEVKANLSRHQVQMLAEAGVHRIQPGIESFSDHVLKLMRKGTTGLRNVQLLKWCKQFAIEVDWNLLYGFPGETAEDYTGMLPLLDAIRFLGPPCACGPVRLDRFSPYFNAPAEFGIRNVRPMATYFYLYPFDRESLARIAYYFDYDYEARLDPRGFAMPVIEYVHDWRQNPERGTLLACSGDDKLVLLDTRSVATASQFVLTGLDRRAYEFCDSIHSASAIAAHLHAEFPTASFELEQVVGFLDSLVANALMLTDGINYLSLAIQRETLHAAATPKPIVDASSRR